MCQKIVSSKEQIVQMVRNQIEYYFSPENLDTDIYLRRKMDAQGYIPLSSIASFNRVKSLSQEAELIVAAVKQSKELDMSTTRTAAAENSGSGGSGGDLLASILVRPKTDPLKWPLASPEPVTSAALSSLNPHVPEFVPKTPLSAAATQGSTVFTFSTPPQPPLPLHTSSSTSAYQKSAVATTASVPIPTTPPKHESQIRGGDAQKKSDNAAATQPTQAAVDIPKKSNAQNWVTYKYIKYFEK